ncbi:MAG: MATE family efflux transporter [Planctomycetota bacterium]
MTHEPEEHDEPALTDSTSGVGPDDPPLDELPLQEAEALDERAGVIRSGKLAGRSLGSAIWILAMPVFVQQTMHAGVGMVDKIIAGDLRPAIRVAGMDAIGVGSYVGWLIGIAMAGLGIGGQAIIARAMGAGRVAESHRALGQAITLSVLWGGLVGTGLWHVAEPLARMCQMTDQATAFCVEYVRTLAVAMPMCGLMMVGGMCMHGAGETTRPSAIAILVNLANIVFSWALSGVDLEFGGRVYRNPFGFDLDVMGIAAGTAAGYVLGGVLTLFVLVRGVKDLRLQTVDLPLERPMILRIVRVGVPNFLEGLSMWGANLFILMFIGWIERRTLAGGGLQGAHIIAVQWEAFSFMPGFAIGTAAGALAGQYLGAGNPRMARRAVLTCTAIGMCVMGALGILFMTQGASLTRLISPEEIHLEHAPRLLFICGTVQIFFALTMIVRQGLRGVGDTKWTFVITTVSSYGVRLPAAYLLGVQLELGIAGIWYALCGEFVVRSLLFCGRFFHGGWAKVKV